MKTQVIDGVEVHRSSGNVFADLGFADVMLKSSRLKLAW